MSRDRAEGPVSTDLPESIREWVAERATEEGLTEEELLSRLLSDDGVDTSVDPAVLKEQINALEDAVAELDSDVDTKIEDVRERVVQVKREADAKASADHEHPDFERRFERIVDEIGAMRSTIDEFDDRLDGGFENYEEVLEHLVETSEELEHKLDVLAGVILDLRERTDALIEARAGHAALAELTRAANVHGARSADCGACGESVDIGLLSAPRCPHCAETFSEFKPGTGFFGSPTLEVGTTPALDPGDHEGSRADLGDLFDPAVVENSSDSGDRGVPGDDAGEDEAFERDDRSDDGQ